MASFYVENFGCRATQADGAAIERQFQERGLDRADTAAAAKIVVLNTCTVTAAADQDARAAIRRIRRQNPECQIVVTGCYAQRAPEEVASLPGVSCVVGNSHKHQVADLGLRISDLSQQTSPSEVPHEANGFVPLEQLTNDQRPTTNDEFPQPELRRLRSDVWVGDIFAHTELLAAPVFDAANERTRPNLKVQDGCDNRCSFCVIPYVRGQSRSLPLQRVLNEVRTLVAAGYREVVISGINLGRWGRELSVVGPWSLVVGETKAKRAGQRLATDDRRLASQLPVTSPQLLDLIQSILDHTPLEKLRISSVEPMDWSDDLIALVATSPRIAKHAHVPMQSGSDRVLRRMHRKYRPWHYREKIEKIHAAMPAAAIGADVMVGFPGETDADFEASRRLIEDLPFTYLHVFTYSPRPGTPAADITAQVPVAVARERNRILRELVAQKKLAFMRSFIGKTVEVITLHSPVSSRAEQHDSRSESRGGVEGPCVSAPTFTESLTDNYLKLRLRGHHQPNRWMTVQVENVQDETLVGTVENSSL